MSHAVAEPLLELRDLRKAFAGVVAVDGVSLSLWEGELLALIGPNGSGKSTLFNVISGLHQRTGGQIVWCGDTVKRPSLDRTLRAGMSRTFQEASNFPDLSVEDCMDLATLNRSAEADESVVSDDLIQQLYVDTGLAAVAGQAAGSLPYGMGRLLGVLMAISTRPRLLMLDEPAAGLGQEDVHRLSALLNTLHERGLTIAIVDHDMQFILSLATRVIVLNAGAVIFEGSPEDVVNDPVVRQAYLGSADA